ncbi:glycoprotein E, partial [Cervid alphaherpesvirus 2]
ETCIFHPEAPACLHPVDARCSFASPYRSETVYGRLYPRCDPAAGARWPRECEGASYTAPGAHARPAENGADLVFADAPAAAAGLYVFVLQYNGHVEAWDYSLVATSDRLVRAVVDHTRPEAAEGPGPSAAPGGGEPASAPAPARRFAPWLVALGGVLALVALGGLAALGVWGCAQRAARRRTYDILNPFGSAYTSLPTNDP